jgi:hypothetical protein
MDVIKECRYPCFYIFYTIFWRTNQTVLKGRLPYTRIFILLQDVLLLWNMSFVTHTAINLMYYGYKIKQFVFLSPVATSVLRVCLYLPNSLPITYIESWWLGSPRNLTCCNYPSGLKGSRGDLHISWNWLCKMISNFKEAFCITDLRVHKNIYFVFCYLG